MFENKMMYRQDEASSAICAQMTTDDRPLQRGMKPALEKGRP